MKVNQLKTGVILTYLNVLLYIFIGIVITPLMLQVLGKLQYGLYQFIGVFVGYLIIFDFGLGNTIIRYIAQYRQQKDSKSESNFLSMTFIIYGVILACVVLFGIIIYNNLAIFVKDREVDLNQAKLMFAILAFNLAITLPGNAFNAIIIGYERYTFNRGFNTLRIVLRVILLIVILKIGCNATAIIILDTTINIFAIIVNVYYCIAYLKIKIVFHRIDRLLLKEVFGYSIFIFLNVIIDQLLWRVAPTIIRIKISMVAVAVFAVGMQFSNIFVQFSTAVSGVFLPRLTRMVIAGDSNMVLTDFMIRIGRLQGIVLLYIYLAFATLGNQFIYLWVGNGYRDSWLTALLVMTGLLIPLMQNTGLSILQAMKKNQFYVITYLIIFIFNMIATIFIIDFAGIIGAAIIIMLSLFIGHGVFINWYYNHKIGLNIPRFFKELFRGIALVVIGTGIIMYCITQYLVINSWKMFIMNSVILTIIYLAGIWFIGMNQYEKKLFLEPINKIFIKKGKK